MTEIIHLHHTYTIKKIPHLTIFWIIIMVGRRLLSGKEHKIRFKVCIALCKNIVPETEKLKRRAYFRVSQELFSLGVSPRFVADVWRKHKGDILDPLNKDLYMVVKKKLGSGRLRKISILE